MQSLGLLPSAEIHRCQILHCEFASRARLNYPHSDVVIVHQGHTCVLNSSTALIYNNARDDGSSLDICKYGRVSCWLDKGTTRGVWKVARRLGGRGYLLGLN
jgi:hypothetical protein